MCGKTASTVGKGASGNRPVLQRKLRLRSTNGLTRFLENPRIPVELKVQVINGLCNGLSLRAASRVFGVHRTTIMNLLVRVGKRTSETALDFLTKLRATLDGPKPQIFSDGWNGYAETIEEALGPVSYAQIVKEYQGAEAGRGRYAPPKVLSISKRVMSGDPDMSKAGTSRIERSNWTVRTMQRRFTRLAAGFSRKLENLHAACAIYFAYCNFVWQVRTLGGPTPAMAAGAVSTPWNVADLVAGC